MIYLLQTCFLLLLFFLFRSAFGYLCLLSLLLGQLASILVANLFRGEPPRPIFWLLRALGGGFYEIAEHFSDIERYGGFSRSYVATALFSLQCLAVLTLFYLWLFETVEYLVASLFLSLAVMLGALLVKRDWDERIAICLLILLMPGFGYLIFLTALPRLYFARYSSAYASPNGAPKRPVVYEEGEGAVSYLTRNGYERFGNTEVTYFSSGTRFFEDLLSALAEAERYIYIEFFIFEFGESLEALLSLLEKKAGEGVEVRVICDDLATRREVYSELRGRLAAVGGACARYNRMLPLVNTFAHYRDHRKAIVVDGRVSYTGGVNVADEYVNKTHPFGYWKDAGVRLEGDAATAFTDAFCRQWYAITGERLLPPTRKPAEGTGALTVPYFDGMSRKTVYGVYRALISSAREQLVIITPYLVPGSRMLRLLASRARAGVEVCLILPQRADKEYVHTVTLANARYLHRRGVKVFMMRDSFTHAKVILTECTAAVGTANFDYLSFYKCAECGIVTEHPQALEAVRADIASTVRGSDLLGDEYFRAHRNECLLGVLYGIVSFLM